MERLRTIRLSGPFTDEELIEFLGLLRRIDERRPAGLYSVEIVDPDGSCDAAEGLLRQALPPMPDRATAFARAAYHNEAFPVRLCDRCKRSYRGPAVYCSLECAVADATPAEGGQA